jgi:hypothetical protein
MQEPNLRPASSGGEGKRVFSAWWCARKGLCLRGDGADGLPIFSLQRWSVGVERTWGLPCHSGFPRGVDESAEELSGGEVFKMDIRGHAGSTAEAASLRGLVAVGF